MKRPFILTTILTFSATLSSYVATAADTVAQKYPRIVLVQLRSEHNRIEALTRQNQFAELQKVKEAAVEVQKHMIADFTDNFHYCPVYYYMDTNLQAIKDQHFDGVLFRADGSAVTESIVSNGKDYVLVYYGYPVTGGKTKGLEKDPQKYSITAEEPFGKGLVVNNTKFQQIAFVYKFGYQNWAFRLGKRKKYVYFSKNYDIEYFPLAKWFNDLLYARVKHHKKATPFQDFLNRN